MKGPQLDFEEILDHLTINFPIGHKYYNICTQSGKGDKGNVLKVGEVNWLGGGGEINLGEGRGNPMVYMKHWQCTQSKINVMYIQYY